MTSSASRSAVELRTSKVTTVIAGAICILIVAFVLNTRVLYWMAGCLVVLPLVSRTLGKLQLRGLVVSRRLRPEGCVGDQLQVRLVVRNTTRWPRLMLAIQDELPSGLEADPSEPLPVHLLPYGEEQVDYTLLLRRRGVYRLDTLRLLSLDLLDLRNQPIQVAAATEVVVYPRVIDLEADLIPTGQGFSPQLSEASPSRGNSITPYGVRDYVAGDSFRQIHWRTTARRGQLSVIEREAEFSADLLLAVDARQATNVGQGNATTLECALGLAASLATHVLRQGESVRLLVPGCIPLAAAAPRGDHALAALLLALARLQETEESGFAERVSHAAGRLSPGTRVCLITAAPDPELLGVLQSLRDRQLAPALYGLDGPSFQGQAPDPGWSELARQLVSRRLPVRIIRRGDRVAEELLVGTAWGDA